ncbi:DUF1311 domain-containing protein [Aestuariivirga litoralis]|uniref:DUF1311 domain-containing protein n=1 Tax=Aestuariivirga litoralis TaxID=2650924 RepID=A0A2W2BX81_9HYPH|nr:lysozyme inhibitor LprI family protein [Aestuariivirga litoralis]PZF78056.1 DUF1311 domain-containing protein [Aestuariivirga litoralis]
MTLVLISPAHSDPLFSPELTSACVSAAVSASPGLSGSAVLDCIGKASQACMTSPGGDTTIGMVDCLQGELAYWDKRLNAAYAKRLAVARKDDAEMKSARTAKVSVEESLRNMQRAWIAFRDAACLYEQVQWMGGSGGGPATAACRLQETARQALRLEGWWSQ